MKFQQEYDKYMKTHLTQAEKDSLESMGEDIKKFKWIKNSNMSWR